jgi:hypothetical protein
MKGKRVVYAELARPLQEDGMINEESIAKIQCRNDLVAFIRALAVEFQRKPEWWINDNLEAFLEACSAWLEDSEGYYANRGEAAPQTPAWKNVAEMLVAAAMYE